MLRTALVALVLVAPAAAQLVPRGGGAVLAPTREHVTAVVEDGLVETRVRQTFVHRGPRTIEALWQIPLPDGAALTEVAMEVDGKRLEGLLAERRRARAVYDELVHRRIDPALVEKVAENLFRLSVFPVVPDVPTVVEIAWVQPLPLVDGVRTFLHPIEARGEGELVLDVTLRSSVALGEVRVSNDAVHVVRRSENEVHASFEGARTELAGDFAVTAEVSSQEPRLAVASYRDDAGDGWFVAVLTPPRAAPDQLLPRDVILVLDTSGSMRSDGKIEQARRSARWLLENLRAADRVNVLRFSSDVQAFADAPVPATPDNLAALASFVDGFAAGGSTALGDALTLATRHRPEEGRVGTVVLLTDGRPTLGEQGPAALVEMGRIGAARGLRIFPFGVGNDLDAGLLRGIAAAGRGRAEVFRPGGEIEARLTAFLARTSSPVIADVALSVEGVDVHDVHPRPLPDGYLGEQLVISGRYRGAGAAKVTVTGSVSGLERALSVAHDFPAAAGGHAAARQLFALEKLGHLEDAHRLRLGLADDAYYAALDRGAYSTADEIVEEMIAVSLAAGVQCAYTSFIVLLPEDRARLDPRDLEALEAGVGRAGEEVGRADIGVNQTAGDPDMLADSPFDNRAFNDVIGIGGGAGGKFGGRFGGNRNDRAGGGRGIEQNTKDALEWLKAGQARYGFWTKPEGGEDVGATALSLLAFLGDGNTLRIGPYKDVVLRGVKWLRESQDPDSGRLEVGGTPASARDQALAALALAEAYHFSKSPLIRGTATKALAAVAADAPGSGLWPGDAADEATTTAWALMALWTGAEAGLPDHEATLRRGTAALLAAASEESAEPVVLAAALFVGHLQELWRDGDPVARRLADRLVARTAEKLANVDVLEPEDACFVAHALNQVATQEAMKVRDRLLSDVSDGQRRDGGHADTRGSWDGEPRITATAFHELALVSGHRYARWTGDK